MTMIMMVIINIQADTDHSSTLQKPEQLSETPMQSLHDIIQTGYTRIKLNAKQKKDKPKS